MAQIHLINGQQQGRVRARENFLPARLLGLFLLLLVGAFSNNHVVRKIARLSFRSFCNTKTLGSGAIRLCRAAAVAYT